MNISQDFLTDIEKDIKIIIKEKSKKHKLENIEFFLLLFDKDNPSYAGFLTSAEEIDENIIEGLRGVADQFDLNYPRAYA